MSKAAAIGIRVEPEIKEALTVADKMERRSVASYIEKLIVDDLDRKDLTPPTAS